MVDATWWAKAITTEKMNPPAVNSGGKLEVVKRARDVIG